MVTNAVRIWLRLEGACVLAMLTALYWRAGGRWWVFLVCFLIPDLSLLAYLSGPRLGAYLYNAAHSYAGPALLGLACVGKSKAGVLTALIWGAHIGFDRLLGYGLKYPNAFGNTHLGWIGADARVRERKA